MARRRHPLSAALSQRTETRILEEVTDLCVRIFELATYAEAGVQPDASERIRELAYTIRDRTLVLDHLAISPPER